MIKIKNFIRCFSVYLTVVAILACTAFSFPVGASAVSSVRLVLVDALNSPKYWSFANGIGTFTDFSYDGTIYVSVTEEAVPLLPGRYVVNGQNQPTGDGTAGLSTQGGGVILNNIVTGDWDYFYFEFGEVFEIPSGFTGEVSCASYDAIPTISSVSPADNPLYFSAFEMLANFFYGEGAILTAEQNMVLTILATVCALAVVIVPFVVVWFIIKLFVGI